MKNGKWEMRQRLLLAVVALSTSAASAAHVVQTGSIAEGGFGVATAETLTKDGCGTLLNLFHGKWTPEKVRAVGAHCRKHGCTFTMDEMFNPGRSSSASRYVAASRGICRMA